MKIRNVLSTIILILVLSITVGFSAFVSEMSISNLVAEVRLNEDVRITSVEYLNDESYNVIFNEFDYDTDSIMGNVTFNDENIAATYKITFTNFGNVDSYVELMENETGVNFEFSDSSEGVIDSLGGTKEMTLLVLSPDYGVGKYDFKFNFNFSRVFNVSYEYLNYDNDIAVEGKSYSTYIDEYGIEDITVFMGGRQLSSSEYLYDSGSISISNVNGDIVFRGPKTLNAVMRMNSVLDTNVNFGSSTGLDVINNITYTRSGTENDEYPIYYYRGNVTANNVIFGDFCWKMVRTTATGGVKLIYNGVPAADGSCNNTGTASQIGTSTFNESYRSFAYHGYMYGEVYEVASREMTDGEEIMYGVEVDYTGDTYTLTDTFSTSDWTNDQDTIGASYYYTCFNSSGTCDEVYYINHLSKKSINYITLTSGNDLVSVLVRMLRNQNSSIVKQAVDNWYLNNMTNYTSILENEKWCSDRNAYSGGWSLNPSNRMLTDTYYGAYKRNSIDYGPSLDCSAANNMLYVGNGLTYPVALLTADELTLAGTGYTGYSNKSFLYTGEHWWTMTPWSFSSNMAYNAVVSGASAKLSYSGVGLISLGVRP
ncbi:MAG: hypothetical protein J6C28_07255, partial [Bacilli bacterium]|nr:hypothetical protein [Bacilli bacterium]